MGKGSTRRPAQVADDVFADNWRRIFGGEPETPTTSPTTPEKGNA